MTAHPADYKELRTDDLALRALTSKKEPPFRPPTDPRVFLSAQSQVTDCMQLAFAGAAFVFSFYFSTGACG